MSRITPSVFRLRAGLFGHGIYDKSCVPAGVEVGLRGGGTAHRVV